MDTLGLSHSCSVEILRPFLSSGLGSHLDPSPRPSVPTVSFAGVWTRASSVCAGKEGGGARGRRGPPRCSAVFSAPLLFPSQEPDSVLLSRLTQLPLVVSFCRGHLEARDSNHQCGSVPTPCFRPQGSFQFVVQSP